MDWQLKALTKLMGLQYTVQYKKGSLNGAADALSRKPPASSEILVISTVQPFWLASVQQSYRSDERAQALPQQLAVEPIAVTDFTLEQGILRHKNHIWVGDDAVLRTQIISAFHDSPQGGTPGFPSPTEGSFRSSAGLQ